MFKLSNLAAIAWYRWSLTVKRQRECYRISNSANDAKPCQSSAVGANALRKQSMLTVSMREAELVHSQEFVLNIACKDNCICQQMRDSSP